MKEGEGRDLKQGGMVPWAGLASSAIVSHFRFEMLHGSLRMEMLRSYMRSCHLSRFLGSIQLTFGHFNSQGISAITSTASAPPTPIHTPPNPPPLGV